MVNRIDIHTLTLEELSGVVSLYPWFAGARKELCRRMAAMGEDACNESDFAESALYFGSRKMAYDLLHGEPEPLPEIPEPEEKKEEAPMHRQVIVVGGDYFSQAQYDKVRRSSDNVFASFARSTKDASFTEDDNSDLSSLYTETLAQVYLEQGYKEQAKDIYSKLLLRYPEKNAYFAALIAKLDEN